MQKTIEIKNLWFKYEVESPWILKDINIEIERGESVSIIGQNGSGKTTLAKHLNGLLKPTKGDVVINGINTKKAETWELAKFVGFVFQYPDSQIFADTIFNEVSFGPMSLGFPEDEVQETVSSSLKKVGLEKDLNIRPEVLSTGEKGRLAVADILATRPDIMVLDEPTTGQDRTTCESIMKITKELIQSGKTVITISHDMELIAEWSDRVIVMDSGTVIEDGTPTKIFTDFNLLRKIEISPLQVSSLARLLGLKKTPVTIDDTVELIRGWLSK